MIEPRTYFYEPIKGKSSAANSLEAGLILFDREHPDLSRTVMPGENAIRVVDPDYENLQKRIDDIRLLIATSRAPVTNQTTTEPSSHA